MRFYYHKKIVKNKINFLKKKLHFVNKLRYHCSEAVFHDGLPCWIYSLYLAGSLGSEDSSKQRFNSLTFEQAFQQEKKSVFCKGSLFFFLFFPSPQLLYKVQKYLTKKY